MYKAYKYRIYPNKQQKELIRKTFGCCRFVYPILGRIPPLLSEVKVGDECRLFFY